MSLAELVAAGGGSLFVLLTFIQISPIKINPWTALARVLGRSINGELIQKIEGLENEIKDMRIENDKRNAINDERHATLNRTHILRFNDELLHQKEHTKEHFDQVLEDIDEYEDYCKEHPLYENNKAACAIHNIKCTYKHCMAKNSFL